MPRKGGRPSPGRCVAIEQTASASSSTAPIQCSSCCAAVRPSSGWRWARVAGRESWRRRHERRIGVEVADRRRLGPTRRNPAPPGRSRGRAAVSLARWAACSSRRAQVRSCSTGYRIEEPRRHPCARLAPRGRWGRATGGSLRQGDVGRGFRVGGCALRPVPGAGPEPRAGDGRAQTLGILDGWARGQRWSDPV